uniref:NME/NM23 family member 8 n=1 Tax=Sinocyclocheilus rhinocerous TaxID=307959 RepID=A0A673J5E8_9TELE
GLSSVSVTVIMADVYQQWCGPCRAVVSLFRKIKNELGDELLHFATAEADGIEALEKYRRKCEPTFLFYAVTDEGLTEEEEVNDDIKDHPHDEDSCTVAIIKPDVVAHGKADEIIMKIQDAGFVILAHEERTLSEAEAQDFYQHKAAEATAYGCASMRKLRRRSDAEV